VNAREKSQKLNKEKKYSDALKHFKENKAAFSSEDISGNAYLVSAMITALRHTNNLDMAFKFLEHYKITIEFKTNSIILTSYGWLLYDKYKSENHLTDNNEHEDEVCDDESISPEGSIVHINKSETVNLIQNIIPFVLNHSTDYAVSLLSKLFNIIPKIEKKKPNANWKLISEHCDLIPIDRLMTNCESREVERKGVKKLMEFASDRENWYAYKSKALMKLGKYQECYEVSNLALKAFQKYHYSNDVWFARRIALSKKMLGNSETAILELQQILKRKREWFIEKELAELYKEKEDFDSAFKYAMLAMNNFGDLEYKVELLFLLGELLQLRQEPELSFKHYSLSRLLRISEGWKVPQKLTVALGQFGREDIPGEKYQELKIDLRKYWNTFKQQSQEHASNQRLTGKVKKILHNDDKGADGFIEYDGNKSTYFRVNPQEEIKGKIAVGLCVDFIIQSATESKKERAIQLRAK